MPGFLFPGQSHPAWAGGTSKPGGMIWWFDAPLASQANQTGMIFAEEGDSKKEEGESRQPSGRPLGWVACSVSISCSSSMTITEASS